MPRKFKPRPFSGEVGADLQMAIARVLELAAGGHDEEFGRIPFERYKRDSLAIETVSHFIGFEDDHETPE